jgi:hypothetical protein
MNVKPGRCTALRLGKEALIDPGQGRRARAAYHEVHRKYTFW